MAVPKKRRSKSKKRIKFSNWTAKLPQLIACSNCSTKIKSHTICYSCGYYKNQPVIQIKNKTKSKES